MCGCGKDHGRLPGRRGPYGMGQALIKQRGQKWEAFTSRDQVFIFLE